MDMNLVGMLFNPTLQLSGDVSIPLGETLGRRKAEGICFERELVPTRQVLPKGWETTRFPVSSVDEPLIRSPHPSPWPGSPSWKPEGPPRSEARSDHCQGPEGARGGSAGAHPGDGSGRSR